MGSLHAHRHGVGAAASPPPAMAVPARGRPLSPAVRRRRQAVMLLAPLVVGNLLVLLLCVMGLNLLSAARAYVGGESLWSKGRAVATQSLRSYALSHDPQYLEAFRAALDVPLADRETRQLMEQPTADMPLLRQTFQRGGVSLEDVDAMVRLYRWFGDTWLMAPSIAAWRDGDDSIAELQGLGERMHALTEAAKSPESDAEMSQLMLRLDSLEANLRGLEQRFSGALSDSSREAYKVLSYTIDAASLTLTLSSMLLILAGLRQRGRDEQALADANRRWSLAAEADGIGVFEWDLDSETVRLDARACAIYGYGVAPEGLLVAGAELRTRVDPHDLPLLLASQERAVQMTGMLNLRYRILMPDKTSRHLEVSGLMRDGDSGDEHGRRLVGIVRDISQQLRQEQLAFEKVAAERTAAARVEFLSRLSHELRTPLNAVLGFSELLQLDPEESLSERQRQRVQLISGAGVHLLRLVDDVLDISGIDSGHFKLRRVPTLLAPVLADALDLNGPDQHKYGVRVEMAPLREGLAAWADAQRLGQVLNNLLSNACKYTRTGGCVKLEVQQLHDRVEIAVHDQGPGLTEIEIKQLFQPFKRLPSGGAKPGTGLGLTIVKMLTEQMGGSVTVQSLQGRGSVFSVSLQAATMPAALPDNASALAPLP
jgi:signal transduction histidine kinase